METVNNDLLEIGVADRALSGPAKSGDRHLVKPFASGVLLAVVDGLGHGNEAAEAAEIAVATLVDRPQDSVISLVRRCHWELRRTRGAVMSLASIDTQEETVSWLCVGNVEGMLIKAGAASQLPHKTPVLRGGIVGSQLPPLRAAVTHIARGDTLILVTDGIRSGYAQGFPLLARPQRIADHILTHHGKSTDDALVLVARYMGIAR